MRFHCVVLRCVMPFVYGLPVLAQAARAADPQGGQSPAAATPPAASQPAVPARLAELAFLEGHWSGELPDGRMEEHFSGIEAGTLMGMFRMIGKDGRIQVLEFEVLRQVGDTIEYRFRHFSHDLIAWEPPKEPLRLNLIEKGENRWVWMDADPDHPRPTQPHKVIWTVEGRDRMNFEVIVLRDGKPQTIINSAITRVGSPAAKASADKTSADMASADGADERR